MLPIVNAPKLIDAERKNGWTPESLAAYRAEREAATGLVGGFQITFFSEEMRTRPKPLPEHQHGGRNGGQWSPLTRRLRG